MIGRLLSLVLLVWALGFALFAVTQVPLAIAEGLLGVLLVGFLTRAARPELTRLGLLKEDAGV